MPPPPIGSDYDLKGCIISAGYSWCEILGKCIRVWMQACEYPKNCLTWNDGCNMCQLNDGEIGACTMMYCYQQGMPYCEVTAPEVGIEPWLGPKPLHPIDPLPDGH
jgi:hypothetical protein